MSALPKGPHTVATGVWRVGMKVKHRLGVFVIEAIDNYEADTQLCVASDDSHKRRFKDYAFLFEPDQSSS